MPFTTRCPICGVDTVWGMPRDMEWLMAPTIWYNLIVYAKQLPKMSYFQKHESFWFIQSCFRKSTNSTYLLRKKNTLWVDSIVVLPHSVTSCSHQLECLLNNPLEGSSKPFSSYNSGCRLDPGVRLKSWLHYELLIDARRFDEPSIARHIDRDQRNLHGSSSNNCTH